MFIAPVPSSLQTIHPGYQSIFAPLQLKANLCNSVLNFITNNSKKTPWERVIQEASPLNLIN
jgi:hypothetical protein